MSTNAIPAPVKSLSWLVPAAAKLARGVRLFATDVIAGVCSLGQRSAVLVCLVASASGLYIYEHPQLSWGLEAQAMDWLKVRLEARESAQALADQQDAALKADLAEPEAIVRATASDPSELNRQQAAVAWWLSRRYHVAPEPISRLVQEAWSVGQKTHLDPTLILAVMAVESGFNPFAQSQVGAQGLMQVMTRIHDDKYQAFGGDRAAFDPVTNLRVGAMVLKDCIARAGSVEAGLKYYVGAANLSGDGGYAAKVLAEQNNLRDVANGHHVPVYAPITPVLVQTSAPAQTPAILPATGTAPPASDNPARNPVGQQVSTLGGRAAVAAMTPPSAAGTQIASNDASL